eukprot:238856-Amphidinium_carterae.1
MPALPALRLAHGLSARNPTAAWRDHSAPAGLNLASRKRLLKIAKVKAEQLTEGACMACGRTDKLLSCICVACHASLLPNVAANWRLGRSRVSGRRFAFPVEAMLFYSALVSLTAHRY